MDQWTEKDVSKLYIDPQFLIFERDISSSDLRNHLYTKNQHC